MPSHFKRHYLDRHGQPVLHGYYYANTNQYRVFCNYSGDLLDRCIMFRTRQGRPMGAFRDIACMVAFYKECVKRHDITPKTYVEVLNRIRDTFGILDEELPLPCAHYIDANHVADPASYLFDSYADPRRFERFMVDANDVLMETNAHLMVKNYTGDFVIVNE